MRRTSAIRSPPADLHRTLFRRPYGSQDAEAGVVLTGHDPAIFELHKWINRFGVQLAVRTMSTHLARWGFTAQKPLRRAYEQDPAAVRRWLRRDYPAIAARAKAEGGTMLLGQ